MKLPLWVNNGYRKAEEGKCHVEGCDQAPSTNIQQPLTDKIISVCRIHYQQYLDEQQRAIDAE